MDAESLISAFLASSNRYIVCQTDNSLMQLQRHLEIIDCLTMTSEDLGFFQSGNPTSSQCITHIVNLLLDSNTKCTLIPRALSILQNLSKCSHLIPNLQSVFHVHSAVSVFLQHHGSDVKDPLVLQCFNILENVSYSIKIQCVESHFENTIAVLIKLAESESSQLLKMSLKILSNFIRHNPEVQTFVCTLPNAKLFIKRVIMMLNLEPPIMVYALLILVNLPTNFPIVAKLWTEKHLTTAFQLIIKLLFINEDACAVAALDLFFDLIKVPKYKSCFFKSMFLNCLLKKVLNVFNKQCNDQQVIICLKILNALLNVNDCQKIVSSALFKSQFESSESNCIKIHSKIIEWCINENISCTINKLALNLLKSIIILQLNEDFNHIESAIREAVKCILKKIQRHSFFSNITVDSDLEAYVTIFEIMIILCKKSPLKNHITELVDISVFEDFIKTLLNVYEKDNSENLSCSNLFLMVFELLLMIENNLSNLENFLSVTLNNQKAMNFILYAITSNDNNLVKRALLIIKLIKNDSLIEELSSNISLRNASLFKTVGQDISDSSLITNNSETITKDKNVSNITEKQVDALLANIEKGLNVKDLKQSEIMELYEYKIAILTRKEQELQNYIDAKTAALTKADQIMTQYKCRHADLDAEAARLRTMVKEYESRCEIAVEKYEEVQQKCEEQRKELDSALTQLRDFFQHEKEQSELMQTQMNRQYEQKKLYEEEKNKLLELLHSKDVERKSLTNQIQHLKGEIKAKNKAFQALEEAKDESNKKVEDYKLTIEKLKTSFEQKQADFENSLASAQNNIASLKEEKENLAIKINEKVEEYSQKILELEGEKDLLTEQLKLKETKITDLNDAIRGLNSQLSEKSKTLNEAESSNKQLKSSLKDNENTISKFEKDIKMLELLCKKYETSLEKKDKENKSLAEELESCREQYEKVVEKKEKQVKDMETELEKYKYITGMINQMTSGKIPPPEGEK